MFVYFIIILSRSQQFPTSSSENQVELGKLATGHFMHWSLDFTDDQSTLVQEWLGAVRQQAITWANVDPDLCRHMVSLDHNELRGKIPPTS